MFSSGSMYSFCVLTVLLVAGSVYHPVNMDHKKFPRILGGKEGFKKADVECTKDSRIERT